MHACMLVCVCVCVYRIETFQSGAWSIDLYTHAVDLVATFNSIDFKRQSWGGGPGVALELLVHSGWWHIHRQCAYCTDRGLRHEPGLQEHSKTLQACDSGFQVPLQLVARCLPVVMQARTTLGSTRCTPRAVAPQQIPAAASANSPAELARRRALLTAGSVAAALLRRNVPPVMPPEVF